MSTLIAIVGPTGVGKTDLSLRLAKEYACPIVSCDSRQIFKELKIGVAAPSDDQLRAVKHYFIGCKSIEERYSAGKYELDAMAVLEREFESHKALLLVGGSMLYADAIFKGIDDLPTIDTELREELLRYYAENGIEAIRRRLYLLDPEHYKQMDLSNAKRILHAIEVCMMTGKTFTELRTNQKKQRPFAILKIGLTRPRKELYDRINRRVVEMMSDGLEEEARNLYPKRNLNALNTVGYKELFKYFDGTWSREFAISMIQQNTTRYAKKQLTWFQRDEEINWFHPNDEDEIVAFVQNNVS
ncbi:MAG TPA: tRNA (adenosine(37)-N6)-dimethylallyltransferase MiaA [Paludibacteraceae bacterium]|nr:tRNA (adenosine(37)-N6)-dimethylallyltransferase MiaA [Paludibacteraceae bacterium]